MGTISCGPSGRPHDLDPTSFSADEKGKISFDHQKRVCWGPSGLQGQRPWGMETVVRRRIGRDGWIQFCVWECWRNSSKRLQAAIGNASFSPVVLCYSVPASPWLTMANLLSLLLSCNWRTNHHQRQPQSTTEANNNSSYEALQFEWPSIWVTNRFLDPRLEGNKFI